MAAEPLFVRGTGTNSSASWQACTSKNRSKSQAQLLCFTIRASHSTDKKNKKIEDAVLRAESLATTALELEEARRIKQEEMVRNYNLWDDPTKSNEVLVKLADSLKVVNALKDLRYKAEEAKLIAQLAEMEAIDYGLFKRAYRASLDVSKLLDQYEMSKLLRGPNDIEGASVTIKAGSNGICPEIWAEQLLNMYVRWADKEGYRGRVVDKCCCKNGGIKSATIEFEFEYAFGYLSGETGAHRLINFPNGSVPHEATLACVDVVPLFLETSPDLQISDEDLLFSSPSLPGERQSIAKPAACIQHIPTGIAVQSSEEITFNLVSTAFPPWFLLLQRRRKVIFSSAGERNHFANKMKALNRLNAKLLVIAGEQGVSNVSCIKREAIVNIWQKETRRKSTHISVNTTTLQDCEMADDVKNRNL
ncbi:peptide chain release factor PrfB3 [Citrus sinensis]|uniref:Peptide chain release factor PrfB3 n=1 Tax=Citrus sinensis TaxID=2711 RepID=A0ACB8HY91_CITSI|nr:peptide chain release factor PrfB3 [Citrus sinensis]